MILWSISATRRALLAALLALFLSGCARQKASSSQNPRWEVYFSPHGGCTEAVVREIEKARESVRVQAYSFTSAPIATALREARRRGVDVRVILDHSNVSQHYSEADFLSRAGIPALIDAEHAIAHNKVMVLDRRIVVTGSFNFTRAAEERNAENLLVIEDPELAARYLKNWEDHAEHSMPYAR